MVIAGVIVLIKAVCLFIIQKDLGIATVKENENKTLLPVSQRSSHSSTQEARVFKRIQLKPGLLPIKPMLISLMLMLMRKCVIEERMRDTEAIPAFNTNDKKLAVVQLSLIIRRAKRVFNFCLAPRVERRN